MTLRWARALLVLGGLTYSSWLLALIVPTGLSQQAAFASELEATGRPYAWLFRGADILSGLAIGVGATLAVPWAGRFPWGWLRRLMLVATAAIGYATAIAGALPVDCTSSNGQCRALRAAGVPRTWHDMTHHAISNVSGTGFTVALVAMVLLVVLGAGGPAARWWVWPLAVLSLATSIPVDALVWTTATRGIPQRIEEAAESLFFLVLAWDVGRAPVGRVLLHGWTDPGRRRVRRAQ